MDVSVSPSSPVPLYRQLVDQIRLLVLGGQLQAGERLPGSRELAETLSVNLHTVGKAYQLLVAEGLLEMRRGAGAFVADVQSIRGRTTDEAVLPAVRQLCREARMLGMSLQALKKKVAEAWGEQESES